jgi:TPR repeat protein
MVHVPPFLVRLGLGPDADARAVRRAYARELKQIDQEADLQGFQALRAAYEAALRWAERRTALDDPGTIPAPPKAEPAPEPQTALVREPPPPHEEVPEPRPSPEPRARRPATRSPDDQLMMVFGPFIEEMRRRAADGWDARAALERCLADPRLVNLEVRDLFEWNVIALLAEGWKPGHERLLGAAIELFQWEKDRRRPERFAGPGQVIEAVITEQLAWRTQTEWLREWHLQILERLRRLDRPRDAELLRMRPALQDLASQYPTWTRLVAPVGKIPQWMKWADAVPVWTRAVTRKPNLLKNVKPEAGSRPQSSGGSRRGVWMVVMLALGVLRLLSGMGTDRSPPSPPMAKPSLYANPGTVELGDLEGRCDRKDKTACTQLGTRFVYADGVPKDLSRATVYYQRGCDLAATDACLQLATIVGKGQGVTRDAPRALATFQRACDLGSPAGCTNAGLMIQGGDGVAKDRARAEALLQVGCDRGAWLGCTGLAWILEQSRAAADRGRATLLLENACEKNEPFACNTLAIRSEYGSPGRRDLTRAASLYQASCNFGYAFACGQLAKLMERGAGVARDPIRALALYQKACEQGKNGPSCASLAQRYQTGDGVAKDLALAQQLYEKACTIGVRSACNEAKALASRTADRQ